jgi:hypothetical protein
MKKFKFLTGVIFLINVFVLVGLVGKAHSLTWWGFSSLCYNATLKGSPDTELKIHVVNLTVQAGCQNILDSSVDCKAGVGNSGSFIIIDYPETTETDKIKSEIIIDGCIDLSKYDTHYDTSVPPKPLDPCVSQYDDVCHTHMCYPLNNSNKVEIPGSAYVSSLDVYYDVVNLKNNQIKYSAHQTCYWPGEIDQTTCLPKDDADGSKVQFVCSEEEIINK